MKVWQSFIVALVVTFICGSCGNHSTTAPTPAPLPASTKSPLHLAGVVTDNISRPLAGAVVIFTQSPGVTATTAADGTFTLSDSTLIDGAVSLQIVKDGYTSAHVTIPNKEDRVLVFMTPVDLLTLDGAYTVTFTADDSCAALPAAARTRTYVATFQPTPNSKTFIVAPLSGADLFPFYDKMSGSVSNNAAVFYVDSLDADSAWGEDDPIFERLDANTYVSFDGHGTTSILTTAASIEATFNGTIAYCATSQDPLHPDWPLRCATGALVECKSSQHRMTLTRR
jgi:carboxypeptidase family protein